MPLELQTSSTTFDNTSMHRDDALLKPMRDALALSSPNGVRPSTVSILAEAHRSGKRRDQLLDGLATRICNTLSAKRIAARAIATFIPQLFSRQRHVYEEARDALLAVIRLATILKSHDHDILTIECVAGSSIDSVFPAVDGQGQPVLVMRRRRDPLQLAVGVTSSSFVPSANSVSFVMDRLRELVGRVDGSVWDNLSLSLELEPGPLFALRDHKQLDFFARTLSSDPLLGRAVGFNLDIAHFVLAKIKPELVFGMPHIANRLCHFHVSDHSIGHFGDCPLGDCSLGDFIVQEDERLLTFRRWIRQALEFTARRSLVGDRGLPVFTGLISLELEATKSAKGVDQSYQMLCNILDGEWDRLQFPSGLKRT